MKTSAVLLVQCRDQKGLDAAIADFIYRHNGNILHFEQHQSSEDSFYFARVEWDLADFQLPLSDFGAKFATIANKFGMSWRVAEASYRPRVAIFPLRSLPGRYFVPPTQRRTEM